MIVLLDNYDSFTYNLYQAVRAFTDVRVMKNDAVTVRQLIALAPDGLLLSPGPGRPEHAGIMPDAIGAFCGKIPVLGVCLGHQAVCAALGGRVTYAKRLMHGKADRIEIDPSDRLFDGLPPLITVGRYHSLAADAAHLPDCLAITATGADGEIMAVKHKQYPVYGVQFHPESVLTPDGPQILKNFYDIVQAEKANGAKKTDRGILCKSE